MNALQPIDIEIYQYIRAYLNGTDGVSPTYRQIAARFGFCALSTVHAKMHNLRRHGLIDWIDGCNQSIWLTEADPLPPATLSTACGQSFPLRFVPLEQVCA